jgi:subtilisin family serine protease
MSEHVINNKKKNWFATIWPWLWKILLALLLLLLLILLLQNCHGCSRGGAATTIPDIDERMFECTHKPTDPDMSSSSKTWYLTAIGAFDAWETTTGSENITVAVVDNGFNLGHKEFKDKVVMPYNVWSHSAEVYSQFEDHGTHVAGTAIALADNGNGLCGIAPACKFMPVQVADPQGRMTITSVIDGVIYAIYQGADVINISLGASFSSLNQYPERLQRELINNHFKEEERLWNEVASIAERHKTIIVAAAGNDNVLAGIEAFQRPKNIIIVSAVDKNNRNTSKAEFSNYGEYSTVSAPGVGIYSSYGAGYMSMDGTSVASSVVAGSIALMKSLNRNITAEQAICVLRSAGKEANGNIGPMIQLDKALLKVKNNELNDCAPEKNPKP